MTDKDSTEPPGRVDQRLDCSGLRCPLPLLRTKQALNRLPAGSVLEVLATDAGAERDIPAFLKLSTHRLLGMRRAGDAFHFWIEKGP